MPPTQPPFKPAHNLPEYSVSEVSGALKRTVEEQFDHIRVRGEVSGLKRHSSGHLYFCLKDTDAVLDAVCWRMNAARLPVKPEDGLEVICTGRLTTYPGRSKYQMVVEAVELAGQGALLKLLEDRRKALAAEGLFEPSRKQKIPFLPEVIGVVTSPTGAVIRDILHRLADRFPRRVLLWPVAVQGETAAEQVAAAIRGFNALPPGGPVPRPDVLIVARGGGSLEDLWAFNEEVVVRAAADSRIPLISAVGHETDTTLIDHAADLRAPTPTGAAEKAVPVRIELLADVLDRGKRLLGGIGRLLAERRTLIQGLARGLPDPRRILEERMQRLDDRLERLGNCMPNYLHRQHVAVERLASRLRTPRELILTKEHQLSALSQSLGHAVRSLRAAETARAERCRLQLDQLSHRMEAAARRLTDERASALRNAGALLESYSYEAVLKRGYALVLDGKGHTVASGHEARKAHRLLLRFRDEDSVRVVVDGARKREEKEEERQQSLL